MCNRAATIPDMTTGWYMSFPMFLYVLVFQLLNDKLRNSNTETSDNKAGERMVKICQSVMETMGQTKHELHRWLEKNAPQTTWEFEPRTKWNTRHIHEARWLIFGWSLIEKLQWKGKASWKNGSLMLHHSLSLYRTYWKKLHTGEKQSQHRCLIIALLAEEQGETAVKFPWSLSGKGTYPDDLIPFYPVDLVPCTCTVQRSPWVTNCSHGFPSATALHTALISSECFIHRNGGRRLLT